MVRRKKEKCETIGPLVKCKRSLIPYAKGTGGKNYFNVTLPVEFTEPLGIGHQVNQGTVYFSPDCGKHLLLSLVQWPGPNEYGEPVYEINLEDIKSLMKVEDLTSGVRAFLREEILARIEQGFGRIHVKTEYPDFEEVDRLINDIMRFSRGFAGVECKHVKNIREIIITIEDDPNKVKSLRMNGHKLEIFDFKGLTELMLKQVTMLLDFVISALNTHASGKPRQKEPPSLAGLEASVDFLWAYNCRQLIRAGRYGLFSGIGRYTSINPVALGSFYKLLEHACDQAMGVLEAAREAMKNDPSDQDTRSFIHKLATLMDKTLRALRRIQKPLTHAIESKLSTADKVTIAETLKEYHEKIRPEVGGSGETYVEGGSLLGGFEEGLSTLEPEKMMFLSQAIYPMQKLCKFPANVAMLARILHYQSIRSD